MGKFKEGHVPWNKGKGKEEKKPIDWKIVVIAILCLTALEIAAMFHGINGRLFSFVIAIIAGLAGLSLPQIKLRGH